MYQVLLGEINILVKSNYTIYGYLLIYWRFFFLHPNLCKKKQGQRCSKKVSLL